jgi:hypothetical protein
MKTGTTARLKPPPEVRGIVVERRINPATDELEVLLEWTEGGESLRRWFDADQLEEVTQ